MPWNHSEWFSGGRNVSFDKNAELVVTWFFFQMMYPLWCDSFKQIHKRCFLLDNAREHPKKRNNEYQIVNADHGITNTNNALLRGNPSKHPLEMIPSMISFFFIGSKLSLFEAFSKHFKSTDLRRGIIALVHKEIQYLSYCGNPADKRSGLVWMIGCKFPKPLPEAHVSSVWKFWYSWTPHHKPATRMLH